MNSIIKMFVFIIVVIVFFESFRREEGLVMRKEDRKMLFQGSPVFNPKYPVYIIVDVNKNVDSLGIVIRNKLTANKFKCLNEDQYKKMIEDREKEIYRKMDPDRATDLDYILNLRRSGPTFLQTFWVIAEFPDKKSEEARLIKLSYKIYNYPIKDTKPIPLYTVPFEKLSARYDYVVDSLVESLIRMENGK